MEERDWVSEAVEKKEPEPVQDVLFDKGEWWHEDWKGMPEFIQEDLEPIKTIYVHFEKREDVEAFSKLIGQRVTMTTRSIWYPEAEIGRFSDRRFIDGPEPPAESNGAGMIETFDEYGENE